jgi:hypothetical protein
MPNITQRMSLDMPEAEAQAVRDAVKVLQDTLIPHLIDIGPEDRRALPKMGDKTVAFVEKALEYAREHPDMRPSFVDIDEFARDLAAVETLLALQRPLLQVIDMVEDSLLLAGSEAYSAALAFYESVKAFAKRNVAGAATIADDLARSLPARGKGAPKAEANGSDEAH